MSGAGAPAGPCVAVVGLDLAGMLAMLTGVRGWTEEAGPRSRCGLDYWYAASAPPRGGAGGGVALTAYVNLDQSALLLSVGPRDGDRGDPEGAWSWRAEVDLDDAEGPYAAFVAGWREEPPDGGSGA